MTKRASRESGFYAKKYIQAELSCWIAPILCVIFGVALILRSVVLDWKPTHFDEGINGNFVQQIWREGFYRYDPKNFHGPLYFYVLLFAETIFGKSIEAYRFVTGLISLASVVLIAKHRRFFGTSAVWAALVMAISAGTVFYSRYAIHESLFIFFQILFSFGYFLWREEKSRRAMAYLIAAVVGMMAIKETFFIFIGTWFIAVLISKLWGRLFRPRETERDERKEAEKAFAAETRQGFWMKRATPNDWMIASSIGVWSLLFLFTGFFLNPDGFRDMFAAFAFWTKTGTGPSGHEKPFTYWISLLYRYEWPVLLGLMASLPLILVSGWRERVIALTAFGTWLAYSLIPYKTPWLILSLIWPLALTFGLAMTFASRRGFGVRWISRMAALVALIAAAISMGRINFREYANPKEPYVYVQSTLQMKAAVDTVFRRVQAYPEDLAMRVFVLVRDPWPLPWIFSSFPHLIYGRAEDAKTEGAGVIFVDDSAHQFLEARLTGKFWRMPFQMRDSYENGYVYFEFERFKDLVPAGAEVFDGDSLSAGEEE